MKKVLIVMALMSLIVLVGCSEIPSDERTMFCNNKGMRFSSEYDGGFSCSISDVEYVIQKHQNCCYEEKFIDDLKHPACKGWCNDGKDYDYGLCYHNCQNIRKTCEPKPEHPCN